MLESIDIHSSVAVYVQIENHVQFAIASGKVKAGDRLPTVRDLAQKLNVNPNTVAKAYRDLEVMGYLFSRQGMGVFIAKGIEAKCREAVRRRIISRLHEVGAEAKAAGMSTREIKEVVSRCLASEGGPYGGPSRSLLDLTKKK